MKFKVSRVVVDADIARSAGLSEHPVSSSSRAVLQAIRDSTLAVAFCPQLRDEWEKHQSAFARKWLVRMISSKRLARIALTSNVTPEIERATLTDREKGIALKDAHLVDLALSCDRFITSNDVTARKVFCMAAAGLPELEGLAWAVPVRDHVVLARLVADGGYVPEEWKVRA